MPRSGLSRRATTLLVAAAAVGLPTNAHAQFPGQNGSIVYAQAMYDKTAKDWDYFGQGALFTMLPDGSRGDALPDDPLYDDYEPSWSPDGINLAWVSVGAPKYTGIYTGPAGSTKSKLLAKAKAPDAPAWSPSGQTVAYVDYTKGIFAVDIAAGAKPKLLLRSPKGFGLAAPVYSADGSTLFYTRDDSPKSRAKWTSEIWAAGPTGANPHKVVGGVGDVRTAQEPDVSPDSTRLVFRSATEADDSNGIWVASVDGSGLRKIAASPRGQFFSGPAWSPDGTLILAALQRGSVKLGGSIVTVDPATGAVTRLRSARKRYMGTVAWQSVPVDTPTR